MLGRHIFDHMGSGVKIYHGVEITYGYKTSIGDGAVIRKAVALNDRGGIKIGKNAVIGSYARIFSHSYSPEDLDHVRLLPTTIGDGARIGIHETVLAGTEVPAGQVIGSSPQTAAGAEIKIRTRIDNKMLQGRLRFVYAAHANLSFHLWSAHLQSAAFTIALFEFVLLIFSLSVHECSHAWVASRLGDQTARLQGRVTLNPMYHVDPIGTLLFPAIAIFGPFLGFRCSAACSSDGPSPRP